MKEIELKLTGQHTLGNAVIKIDDKPVKFKKNKFGNLVCNYQTENEKVNVKIYRLLDVGGFFWFITQLFFFLISIFGILDIHRKERCLVIDFEAEIDLKDENKVTLQINSPKENAKAVNVQTFLSVHEISNEYFLDTKAKKKLKGLTLTKLFLAFAIIAATIAVIIIKL